MRWPRSLRLAFAALTLLAGTPTFAQNPAVPAPRQVVDIAAHVAEASQRFGIPEHWIYAVIRTESVGRIGAVSSAGAMGLMQLMPGTWARQRARFGLGSDPFDPRDNIMAGTSYLREMYDRYGGYGMLAAYNAGPGRYEQARDRGRPLPAETRAYVARIAPTLQSNRTVTVVTSASPIEPVRLAWTQSGLFAAQSSTAEAEPTVDIGEAAAATPPASPHPRGGLFASVSGSRAQ